MRHILFDCDNTFGLPGCDVDDGLALLYLLGREDCDVCAITTTYGNSTLAAVYDNTQSMLAELGCGIPLLRGCASASETDSEAVDFLVRSAGERPGYYDLLATGSLTNLYRAHQRDADFFENLREIVVMGGITEPLRINGRELNELNFSCDPQAALDLLSTAPRLRVITGNHCLDAFFDGKEFRRRLLPGGQYIYDKTAPWFDTMAERFGLDGFHNWDVVAAACLAAPELFAHRPIPAVPTLAELRRGRIGQGDGGRMLDCPVIDDIPSFTDDVYKNWLKEKGEKR